MNYFVINILILSFDVVFVSETITSVFDGAFGMGCSPSILSSLSKNSNHRKDSGLYCSNNSDTNSSNKIDIHNDSNTSTALANQILAHQSAATGKDSIEKVMKITWQHTLQNFNFFLFLFSIRTTWRRIQLCLSVVLDISHTTTPSYHRQ